MAALCGTRAVAAESRFLRVFFVSRRSRSAGIESGSESGNSDSSAPKTRPGGFASALERHSELQRKAELGRVRGLTGAPPRTRRVGPRGTLRVGLGLGRSLAVLVGRGGGIRAGIYAAGPWLPSACLEFFLHSLNS